MGTGPGESGAMSDLNIGCACTTISIPGRLTVEEFNIALIKEAQTKKLQRDLNIPLLSTLL